MLFLVFNSAIRNPKSPFGLGQLFYGLQQSSVSKNFSLLIVETHRGFNNADQCIKSKNFSLLIVETPYSLSCREKFLQPSQKVRYDQSEFLSHFLFSSSTKQWTKPS